MKFTVITPFPEVIEAYMRTSIVGRAVDKKIIGLNIVDLRRFGEGVHKKIDDYPYGGGPGMIMKPGPIFAAFRSVFPERNDALRVVLPSPAGTPFRQSTARELTVLDEVAFICGHYKGVDERVRESLVTDEISIGDYVVTGGELPALVIIDAVVRLLGGVIGDVESAETDSFSHPLLDAPHYTRPPVFEGKKVPDILLSGDHSKIKAWKNEMRLKKTRESRSDLLASQLAVGEKSSSI